MFFLIERKTKLQLHPKFFGQGVKEEIKRQLKRKEEGKCSGRYGYTILVTAVTNIETGRLHEDTGFAHFPVTYLALVFRPFKNQVLPAIVSTISSSGIFASAGPLEIFVSSQLMPADMKFSQRKDGLPVYEDDTGEYRIEKGSAVRIKIVGIRLAADHIGVIGSIKDDYLG